MNSAARAACPGIFAGDPCDGAGGTGPNVCAVTGTTMNCDLGGSGSDTYDTNGFFLTPTTSQFRAYGHDSDGEEFCCEISYTSGCANPPTVNIQGTTKMDTVDLVDTTAGLSMNNTITVVKTEDEDDTINGSDQTCNDDNLYGEQNADVIRGREGDDYIEGGVGPDTLYGGPGNDTIYGDHSIYTSLTGDDKIKAGLGDDTVFAGPGIDDVCGEGGSDTLYGADGDDEVYGGAGDDVANDGEGGTNDNCENDATTNGCEATTLIACPF